MCNSQNSTGKYLSLYSISLSSRVPLKGSLTRHLNILCRRRPQTVRRARRGQRRPEEASKNHRHSRGPKIQKFVGTKVAPREEARTRQERPEFARNHSGSIETQRNSRETTAGASKRNGIRAKPQRERRNEGPAPPHAPLRPAT